LGTHGGGQPAQFAAGQTIFAQGHAGTHMYIGRSGSIDIVIDERVVETVGPNGMFGEMTLVDGGARSATARAKSACELAPIDQRTFMLMWTKCPILH
jgi:CRP-like cAMP-binding protein